jgi:hypothetical protein
MKLQFLIVCFLSFRFIRPVIKNVKTTLDVIDFLQKYDHPFFLTIL